MKRLSELLAMAIIQNNATMHPQKWFINYSGHVNQLAIRYYANGYDNSEYEDCAKLELYLNNKKNIKKAIQFLETNLTSIGS